jgi:hypothetical protein
MMIKNHTYLLETVTPSWFLNLRSMESLDLSSNKLTCIKSIYFRILDSSLQCIDLRFNQISNYEPNNFCYLMSYRVDDPGPKNN